jgi:hypothetical protein
MGHGEIAGSKNEASATLIAQYECRQFMKHRHEKKLNVSDISSEIKEC